MATVETVASYRLEYGDGGDIVDAETASPFDTVSYSRMKYGDRFITRQFASELADQLVDVRPGLVEEEVPPEFTTAFKAVPHLPFYLSRYCLEIINELRLEAGLEPGTLVHVHKSKTATSNYAASSEEERVREWSTIEFSLDGHSVQGVPAVILDDIRITGAVEEKALGTFDGANPAYILLGYVAIFNPYQARERPEVENDINSASIRTVEDLIPSIEAGNFDLNIRTLKLILSTAPSELESFLEHCPGELIETMVRGTMDSGADFYSHYSAGYSYLKNALHTAV